MEEIYILHKEGKDFFSNLELNICDDDSSINLADLFPSINEEKVASKLALGLINIYLDVNNLVDEEDNILLDECLKKLLKLQGNHPFKMEINTFDTAIEKALGIKYMVESISSTDIIGIHKQRLIHSMVYHFNNGTDIYETIAKIKMAFHESCPIYLIEEHPKINKLYINILIQDMEQVRYGLINANAMNERYRAYRFALKEGNKEIIAIIWDNISSKVLLSKELLTTFTSNDIYPLIVGMF